ncbi:MAG: replication-relaxation family protein, partial [Acidobacteriota bacterium]|nr:replication-relaxation family protein [Acidobacteriota bacterium]
MTSAEGRAVRVGAAAIAALASRLTERDRLVALACYEHRVLTTEQLRRLHFGSSRRCCARLEQLHRLRVLDRFRPARERGQGSAPYHWVLDEAGAHVVAACLDLDRAELRWRRQTAVAISRSRTLDHQLEVNEFFTRLTEEARHAGGRLAEWWGERRG